MTKKFICGHCNKTFMREDLSKQGCKFSDETLDGYKTLYKDVSHFGDSLIQCPFCKYVNTSKFIYNKPSKYAKQVLQSGQYKGLFQTSNHTNKYFAYVMLKGDNLLNTINALTMFYHYMLYNTNFFREHDIQMDTDLLKNIRSDIIEKSWTYINQFCDKHPLPLNKETFDVAEFNEYMEISYTYIDLLRQQAQWSNLAYNLDEWLTLMHTYSFEIVKNNPNIAYAYKFILFEQNLLKKEDVSVHFKSEVKQQEMYEY